MIYLIPFSHERNLMHMADFDSSCLIVSTLWRTTEMQMDRLENADEYAHICFRSEESSSADVFGAIDPLGRWFYFYRRSPSSHDPFFFSAAERKFKEKKKAGESTEGGHIAKYGSSRTFAIFCFSKTTCRFFSPESVFDQWST